MAIEADVLIVGGGFAGLSCFRRVDRRKRRVALLTDRNHFLFTPLLPLAAVGSVEVRSIVESVHLFEKTPGEVVIGKAVDIFPEEQEVLVKFEESRVGKIRYQTLVIASGAVVNTFSIPGVNEHCFFLKEMKHARSLREKILLQFDKASLLEGDKREAALRFLIVGAGATGVETACEIHDLVKDDLSKYYPKLAQESHIEIIEAARDILPTFDRTLARYAQLKLKQKGIQIRTETPVKAVEKGRVVLATAETVAAETILWTTGNGAGEFTSKIAERFSLTLEQAGRIPVDSSLRVKSIGQNIYAIGDCAAFQDQRSRMLPQTAQVAVKQGIHLGKSLSARKSRAFTFRSMGMLASLGSGSAIADLGTFRLKGLLAWWFWKTAYITRLVSLRNKVSVMFDWVKVRIFGRNTARIDF